MFKISKPAFRSILIIFIAIIIAYFILSSSNDKTFKQAHLDAQQRVENIQKEIVHAENIVQQTKFQLDSMEEQVNTLQAEQTRIINTHHSNNLEITNRLALERENLNQLKAEYNSTQQEKKKLEAQLDSLSIYIQKKF